MKAAFCALECEQSDNPLLTLAERTDVTNHTDAPRVRFAPSPTGELHIGGARTAIYNWAFARANGGTFVLRIEDTDPERSTEENKQVILRSLRLMGLNWDEGPEVGGNFGPYLQTQRTDNYAAALERLKERGAVYPCFCTKEELDAKRAAAEAEGAAYAGYDGCCRSLSPDEAQARIDAGEPHVWRLRVPKDHGPIEFVDAVYGPMSFPADVMDDMIVVRSDGTPTYNFAVVCDDAGMQITHVIRGDDHLSNTPRQILVYEALGLPVPTFAHLSMILGPDGRKLSKRRNATAVEQYVEMGYLPDALINFLALLGWSLDGETTIVPPDVLAREFSLDRITRKDAVFDEAKLQWMNGEYIKAMSASAWVDAVAPFFEKAGLASADEIAANRAWFEKLYPLVAERMKVLTEAPEKLAFLFSGPTVELDEKSVQKNLLKEGSRADEVLSRVRQILANESIPWECDALQDACRELVDELELKPKQVFQPIRVAVTGSQVSPPLFESIELMERADVVSRLDNAIEQVFGGR